LLKAAEEIGRNTGCGNAYVDSFSFQAPEFYKKQGYEEYAVLPEFPKGQSRYSLKKAL
jgi:hypothetical protein